MAFFMKAAGAAWSGSRQRAFAAATGFAGATVLTGYAFSRSQKAVHCEARKEDLPEHDKSLPMKKRMEHMVLRVQKEICDALTEIDGKPFLEDNWERKNHGGGGKSMVLQNGNVFEKAGVLVSVVHGNLPATAVKQMRARGHTRLPEGQDLKFHACGVSLVIHPRNPMAPTSHANYRYFEVETGNTKPDGTAEIVSWFGGGADLTPAYLFEEDAIHFHRVHKDGLDKHDEKLYPMMKKWCDEYFYIPHRDEHRGIGGIFYDDMEDDPEKVFAMARTCADNFIPAYIPIAKRRKDLSFTPEQKRWQQLRRGRYVEFNLVIDRGTKFGLATPGARIESILASLPQTARWEYMHEPEAGSWEEKTVNALKTKTDWVKKGEEKAARLRDASFQDLLEELSKRK